MWFSKNEKGEIVTINEVDKKSKEKYCCAICGSEVIARQGEINDWCFAHIDRSKCSIESVYHFWFKNKLIEKGTKFIIETDKELEFICDDILVEEVYEINGKKYKPDLTVITTLGSKIYFEMDYTNKKKVEDYIDIWEQLEVIVVEIDTKTLMGFKSDKLPKLKPLYYKGKDFKTKEDNIYIKTINDYKNRIKTNKNEDKYKKDLEKLDWLWADIKRYKQGKIDIKEISDIIQSIEEHDSKLVVVDILKRTSCSNIIQDYVVYNKNIIKNYLNSIELELRKQNIICSITVPHKIYERLYYGIIIEFLAPNKILLERQYAIHPSEININIVNDINKKLIEFGTVINEINNHYNYSDFVSHIDYCDFPNVNYYFAKKDEQHRFYLNNTRYYYSYLELDKYNNVEDFKESIISKIGSNKVFNQEEIIKINNITKLIKEEFINEGIVIDMRIKNLYDITVSIKFKDKNYSTISTNKDCMMNIEKLYESIRNTIISKRDELKKEFIYENNINDLILKLNKRYEILKDNWKLKKHGKWLELHRDNKQIVGIAGNSIEDFIKGRITYYDLEKEITWKTSDYIREYIYDKNK
jgi:hypothetical protein